MKDRIESIALAWVLLLALLCAIATFSQRAWAQVQSVSSIPACKTVGTEVTIEAIGGFFCSDMIAFWQQRVADREAMWSTPKDRKHDIYLHSNAETLKHYMDVCAVSNAPRIRAKVRTADPALHFVDAHGVKDTLLLSQPNMWEDGFNLNHPTAGTVWIGSKVDYRARHELNVADWNRTVAKFSACLHATIGRKR